MTEEIWKDIPGYEELYEVSNFGNVRSISRFIYNKSYKYWRDGVLLKPSITRGYERVSLYRNGVQKLMTIHRLVAMAFLDYNPEMNGFVINHIDICKTNNSLENLEIVSTRENSNQKHLPSTSDYVGVSYKKQSNAWVASIHIDGKTLYIGTFKEEVDAANAYEKALHAVNNGIEIPLHKKRLQSKYPYVIWEKANKKWRVRRTINKKTYYIGLFEDEYEAHLAYEKFRKEHNL